MIINIFYTSVDQFKNLVEICKIYKYRYEYSLSSNWMDIHLMNEIDEDNLIGYLEDMRVNYQYA